VDRPETRTPFAEGAPVMSGRTRCVRSDSDARWMHAGDNHLVRGL
jgi:hypothetical protein